MKTQIPNPTNMKPKGLDYTTRRQGIYKGKLAPKGHTHIVVKVVIGKRWKEAFAIIETGKNEAYEKVVENQLLQVLRDELNS